MLMWVLPCAFAHESVDGADYGRFVAGDGVATEDYDVGGFDLDIFVGAGDHAVEHGVELALGAGADYGYFVVGEFDDVFHFEDCVFGDFYGFGSEGYFDVVDHGEAG